MVKQGEVVSKKILAGVEKLKNCVVSTLGPRGKNVLININNQPIITNDGVTIAKHVTLEDKIENYGAEIAKQASIKTNDIAGDGTTTAILLTSEILSNGYKSVTSGNNPIFLRKGILKASRFVCNKLKEISCSINSSEDIKQIATISAKDEKIGKLIAEAYLKVGKYGAILAEDGKNVETELVVTKGMQFDRGYISPYMANTDRQTCEFDTCLVLVTDRKIQRFNELLPILEKVGKQNLPLLIIAEDFDNETISTLVLNKMRGVLRVCALKAPEFGQLKEQTLSDICALSNAKFISYKTCEDLSNVNLEDLGKIKSLKVSTSTTTMIGFESKELNNYIKDIEKQIENEKDISSKEKLKIRYSKLTSGVAQIKVGGASEVEQNEMKLKLEDALAATKAAIDEGVVCGGGIALIHIQPYLQSYISSLKGEEKKGAQLVYNALSAPVKQIVNNCGGEAQVVLNTILDNLDKENFGYNAENGTYCDMKKSGIIDPTKVTITALSNAASVAATLLTTDCVVSPFEN